MKTVVFAMAAACINIGAYAQVTDPPLPKPTARDLYVGCYLSAHQTDVPKDAAGRFERFSGAWCDLASLKAVTNREGKRPEHKGYTFCLPESVELNTNLGRAMALAYLDYYESIVTGIAGQDGETAYTVAMIKKWPCR